MNQHFEQIVLQATGAQAITAQEVIQTLWSGYGEIVKLSLAGAPMESVVLKYISLPDEISHPRGWNTSRSHARKVKSYDVEMHWYRDWSNCCDDSCRVAKSLTAESHNGEHVIVLEDLDAAGFPLRKTDLEMDEVKTCLNWLAAFHARFLGVEPTGLWSTGSYWHLATRPDELEAMVNGPLKQAAKLIDRRLNECEFKTLVHGDAKVANFCFSNDGSSVAAVDFQYVGGGCGMKDVAYFLGSCLSEAQCARWEKTLLDYYFDCLKNALTQSQCEINKDALEAEWRELFPPAWADFHRFLLGWAPDHWKVNEYSEQMVKRVLNRLALS